MFTLVNFYYTTIAEKSGDWLYSIVWDNTGKLITYGRTQKDFFNYNLLKRQIPELGAIIRKPTEYEKQEFMKRYPYIKSEIGKMEKE